MPSRGLIPEWTGSTTIAGIYVFHIMSLGIQHILVYFYYYYLYFHEIFS
jgi:hypothetical protein